MMQTNLRSRITPGAHDMLSTKFLLIRAKRALINDSPVAAAYFCEIAADLAAEHGTPDQEDKCRRAAQLCLQQVHAQLSAC